MQNIHVVIRNSALASLLFFIPLYPVSLQEWVSGDQTIIIKPSGIELIKRLILENKIAVITLATLMLAPCVCHNVLEFIQNFQSESANTEEDDRESDFVAINIESSVEDEDVVSKKLIL